MKTPLRCTRCGKLLALDEAERGAWPWAALACDECRDEVDEEADKDLPVWPSDWYGHCTKNFLGHWMTWEDQRHV